MDSVTVRRGASGDIGQILDVWALCGLSPWPRTDLEQEIGRRDAIFLVAEPKGAGVLRGFILGRLVPSSAPGVRRDAEIYNIGVDPGTRNSGIGSALLKGFIELCRDAAAGTLWLEVRVSNESAINFYRNNGFSDSGTRKAFYRDPVEDALLMSLPIAAAR